jgi:SAM-dependent methyltransferase
LASTPKVLAGRETLRAAWLRLRGGELTATRAGLSVAVGLAIGVTPLWGLHLVLVLAVCIPLALDAPLAYLAANVSIPVFAPFLTMAELEIGSYLMTGGPLPTSLALVRAHGIGTFARQLVVGTVVFAPTVAVVGGGLAFAVVRLAGRRRGARPTQAGAPIDAAIDRVAARYARSAGRATYHYVRGKLASDPVARTVVGLAGDGSLGDVLDLGCGRGQLGVLLLEARAASRVTGFDWDAKKVAHATRAAEGLDATYAVGDLRTPPDTACDTALLIDVLHYLTAEEQDGVLLAAARAARRTVVVRELDPDRGWRSRVTALQEAVTTTLGYNRGARVNVRPIVAITRLLEATGFAVEVTPCWGATPFANVLVVARRGGPTGATT